MRHNTSFDLRSVLFKSLLLFIFILPLSQFISVRLLIGVTILSFFVNDGHSIKIFFNQASDIILYLGVLIIGLLYSSDLTVGFRVLETSFSLIMLPIVFNKIMPMTKERFHLILMSFVAGVILSSSVCLGYAFFKFNSTGDVSYLFFDKLTEIINSQPTYIAYYICFSITVILYLLYYEKLKIPIIFSVCALIFLFLVLMLTGGRTAYISMLFVFSYFILKFLFEEDRIFYHKVTFGFAVFFLISMLLINHFNINTINSTESGDYWERLSLWISSIDGNPDLLFGVGTGDYKVVMNKYYTSHNLSQYVSQSFNSHNQFLQSLFSNGVMGLLSVLLIIGRPLYLSVRYQNILGILVFFSFIIYGMTEVFLGRYQGVIFFALLHQLFISFYYSRQPSFSLKR